VIFQKLFPDKGMKLYPDDPAELGFVLQRKYEVVFFTSHLFFLSAKHCGSQMAK